MRLTSLWRRRDKDEKVANGEHASRTAPASQSPARPGVAGAVRLHASDGNGGLVSLPGEVLRLDRGGLAVRVWSPAEAGSVWWIAANAGQHQAFRVDGCETEGRNFVLAGHLLGVENSRGVANSWLEFVNGGDEVRRLPAVLHGADGGSVDLRTPGQVPDEAIVHLTTPTMSCLGKVTQVVSAPHEQRVLVDVWTEAALTS